jgi:hypothetical protein
MLTRAISIRVATSAPWAVLAGPHPFARLVDHQGEDRQMPAVEPISSVPEPVTSAPVALAYPPAPTVAAKVTVSASSTSASRVVGKTRNPWGVWLLGLTIVYPWIWYFKINKELRDFSHEIDVQPGLATLARGALCSSPSSASALAMCTSSRS